MPPPRIGLALLRQRQDAGRRPALGHGEDYLLLRTIEGHRRLAAVMVARQIPQALGFGRREDGNRKRRFEPYRRRQQLAPDPRHRGERQHAAMPGGKPPQDLRLARGLIERHIAALLADRHSADDLGPFDQQIVQPIVDLVDMPAQICEIGRVLDMVSDMARGPSSRSPSGRNQRKR